VLPLDHQPRALVNRDTPGMVKLVAERPTGRIVGASIVAAGAGDAILAAVYAVKHGMTVDEMADTWAPDHRAGDTDCRRRRAIGRHPPKPAAPQTETIRRLFAPGLPAVTRLPRVLSAAGTRMT
jgi:hypothetical protein